LLCPVRPTARSALLPRRLPRRALRCRPRHRRTLWLAGRNCLKETKKRDVTTGYSLRLGEWWPVRAILAGNGSPPPPRRASSTDLGGAFPFLLLPAGARFGVGRAH